MTYGLLGHPLGHSLSPKLHQLLCAETGAPMNYVLYDLAPEELPARRDALLRDNAGLNVTIPYKQTVLPWLTRLDEGAKRFSSVNTIRMEPDGPAGYNTDCVGFARSIAPWREEIHTALIVGAGGVGRMFALELARMGVSVTVAARPSSLARARDLAAQAGREFGVPADAAELEPLQREPRQFDLMVNATPCGMFPHTGECPVEDALIGRCAMVFDSIYNPAETQLLQRARRMGKRTMGGLRMLVLQGAASQEIWMGARFDEGALARIEGELTREVGAQ